MFFRKFGEARSLAPPFVFSVACARSGIPLLLVAPPSGGKSTVIFSVEDWLKKHKEEVLRVSRLGLRGLQAMATFLKHNARATLLNEDYALIGSSGYMVEKMGELIGALAYSRTYTDYGMKIHIDIERLGFVSGVQPYWIYDMVTNPVFATHLREKFPRYYMLPFSITRDIPDMLAREILSKGLRLRERDVAFKIPEEFEYALTVQVGSTRAHDYAQRIARQLSYLVPEEELEAILKFYALRLGFESVVMEREIGDRGYLVTSRWHEYTLLYWLLRKGQMSRENIANALGVTSMRSVDLVTTKAISRGWAVRYLNKGYAHYIPTLEWKKRAMA